MEMENIFLLQFTTDNQQLNVFNEHDAHCHGDKATIAHYAYQKRGVDFGINSFSTHKL